MCIKIYIFNFKKQTNNQKNQKQKKKRFQKKEEETEEEKRVFPEDRLKKKICGQEYFFFGLAWNNIDITCYSVFANGCYSVFYFRNSHSER